MTVRASSPSTATLRPHSNRGRSNINVISQLEREWPILEQRALAQALPDWRRQQPALHHFETPRRLLRSLHSAAPGQSDQILLALLTLARTDRLPGRFLLQAILPALKAQAKRPAGEPGRRDEVWELLLFYGWEAICNYPLERRRSSVAANLVLQVLHDTTRELRRQQHELTTGPAGDDPDQQTAARSDASVLSAHGGVISAAVTAGVISDSDAELILRTRIDGTDLRSLACSTHLHYPTLLKRRQRAEAAVRHWLPEAATVRKPGRPDLTSRATGDRSPLSPVGYRSGRPQLVPPAAAHRDT